ncbi:MAG: peptidoglycan DD-metalloendopeptidase family protein [Clostridia bacterium]|nr:peptidoglycan DD-metalloendopeptidase family protein [Clostridia bacterium]
MLKNYKDKAKGAAEKIISKLQNRRFIVTAVSAVLTLALLTGFWNYFILPQREPAEPRAAVEKVGAQRDSASGSAPDETHSKVQSKNSASVKDSPVSGDIKEASKDTSKEAEEKSSSQKDNNASTDNELPQNPDLEAMIIPIEGKVVKTFGFSYSNTYDDYRYHRGVDIAAPEGSPVSAVLGGIVEKVTSSEHEGTKVIINHGGGWKSVYSHLGTVEVEAGQNIPRGAFIGRVGTPGISEAPLGFHLHFEITKNGKPVDPALYIDF